MSDPDVFKQMDEVLDQLKFKPPSPEQVAAFREAHPEIPVIQTKPQAEHWTQRRASGPPQKTPKRYRMGGGSSIFGRNR